MSEIILQPGQLLRFDAAPGAAVRVQHGRVWLTEYANDEDRVLRTGDTADVQREGAVVVTAFEPSLLELYRADRLGVRERLQRAAEREQALAIGQAVMRGFAALKRALSRRAAQWWAAVRFSR
jgi:hypothetical protein